MSVVLTISESHFGLWRIKDGLTPVADGLNFAHAVRLAGELARDELTSSGREVRVEMTCAEFTVDLARYASATGTKLRMPIAPQHFSDVSAAYRPVRLRGEWQFRPLPINTFFRLCTQRECLLGWPPAARGSLG